VLVLALVVLVLAGVVIAFALGRRRAKPAAVSPVESWADAAGPEFASLAEVERCDLVFAVAALEDPSSQAMLERALDDPAEAVALAAARALVRQGRGAALERYLASHPGRRAERIAHGLELLA
jgi:hypothetical protein